MNVLEQLETIQKIRRERLRRVVITCEILAIISGSFLIGMEYGWKTGWGVGFLTYVVKPEH